MNCFEFEGKKLLASYGVPVPGSRMLYSASDTPPAYPFVLKSQVLTGGRGKAGGIQVCKNEADYKTHTAKLFGMDIKGHTVHSLLAEEMLSPQQEWYIAITLQGGGDKPVLMASPMGGMDIEEVAKTNPDKILKLEIEPFVGLKDYQLKRIAAHMGAQDPAQLSEIVGKLAGAFDGLGAILVEINPLGVVDGKLIAMDAKVVLDDHNQRRIPDVFDDIAAGRAKMEGYTEPEEEKTTITYVPLDGEVGLISDGAGTGMLTLDLVYDAGGTVASFAELGGVTNADVMYRAMELTMQPENNVKSLLIVLIGGFNRMDDMAHGIIRYLDEHKLDIPVYARMCGTMEEEGIRLMTEAGYTAYSDLTDTVELSVKAAKGA